MNNQKTFNLKEVVSHFDISGKFLNGHIHTSGHINDTFVIDEKNSVGEPIKFILQRINISIFKNPKELMENIENVTLHIRNKLILEGKDPDRGTLNIVKTASGSNFYEDSQGNCWRVYNFINDAKTYDRVEKPEHMYKTGKAIGNFHKQLSDFPMEKLHETIKNFHHTAKRFEAFKESVNKNLSGRAGLIGTEINFILTREQEAKILTDLLEKGEIPLRVTHNDTKFNNIMLDSETEEPIAVIDLDTVMPGLSLYDFGDSMRSGATTALEDETDLTKVNFDITLFEEYTKGFLETASSALNETEIKYLAFSAKLITFEQALRFLGDYIDGDLYYKIKYPNHNLDRARNQIKLVQDMENNMTLMNEIVYKYLKK